MRELEFNISKGKKKVKGFHNLNLFQFPDFLFPDRNELSGLISSNEPC